MNVKTPSDLISDPPMRKHSTAPACLISNVDSDEASECDEFPSYYSVKTKKSEKLIRKADPEARFCFFQTFSKANICDSSFYSVTSSSSNGSLDWPSKKRKRSLQTKLPNYHAQRDSKGWQRLWIDGTLSIWRSSRGTKLGRCSRVGWRELAVPGIVSYDIQRPRSALRP